MKIMFYFADKSVAPFVLDHDLNFQKNHYEVIHPIVSRGEVRVNSFKHLLL